jgi:hypothetical protein
LLYKSKDPLNYTPFSITCQEMNCTNKKAIRKKALVILHRFIADAQQKRRRILTFPLKYDKI